MKLCLGTFKWKALQERPLQGGCIELSWCSKDRVELARNFGSYMNKRSNEVTRNNLAAEFSGCFILGFSLVSLVLIILDHILITSPQPNYQVAPSVSFWYYFFLQQHFTFWYSSCRPFSQFILCSPGESVQLSVQLQLPLLYWQHPHLACAPYLKTRHYSVA